MWFLQYRYCNEILSIIWFKIVLKFYILSCIFAENNYYTDFSTVYSNKCSNTVKINQRRTAFFISKANKVAKF